MIERRIISAAIIKIGRPLRHERARVVAVVVEHGAGWRNVVFYLSHDPNANAETRGATKLARTFPRERLQPTAAKSAMPWSPR
jgi:hypothetical protein